MMNWNNILSMVAACIDVWLIHRYYHLWRFSRSHHMIFVDIVLVLLLSWVYKGFVCIKWQYGFMTFFNIFCLSLCYLDFKKSSFKYIFGLFFMRLGIQCLFFVLIELLRDSSVLYDVSSSVVLYIIYILLTRCCEYFVFTYHFCFIDRMSFKFFKYGACMISLLYFLGATYHIQFFRRFKEFGVLFLFTFLYYHVLLFLFDHYYIEHEKLSKNYTLMMMERDMEKDYREKMKREQKESRKMKHNMMNHLIAIHSMIDDGQEAKDYIQGLLQHIQITSQSVHTGEYRLDVLLDTKITAGQKCGIVFQEDYRINGFGRVDMGDLMLLMASLLDNAIEGTCQQGVENKWVHIHIYNKGGYLLIQIENSIPHNKVIVFNQTSKTDKPYEHGFGYLNIEEIVNKYDGHVSRHIQKDKVVINVMLFILTN